MHCPLLAAQHLSEDILHYTTQYMVQLIAALKVTFRNHIVNSKMRNKKLNCFPIINFLENYERLSFMKDMDVDHNKFSLPSSIPNPGRASEPPDHGFWQRLSESS